METETGPARQNYTLVFRNTRDVALRLVREPQGDEFPLPPGGTLEIRAEGPAGGDLEVDWAGDSVTIWGWCGSVVSVYRDGVSLSGRSLPVPAVPAGMSVRGFLGMILGRPTGNE